MRCYLLMMLCAVLASCGPTDDPQWEEAFDATETGWLLSTYGASDDNVFAVGGEPTNGVIMHFDGTEWSPVDVGMPVPLLNWVHGFGGDDYFIVGNGGTILRGDGETFTKMDAPTTEDLWGIWGSSPDDVWAVGGRGRPMSVATVLRFDGTAWTAVDLPELMRPNVNAFFKVWGSSADDVIIVGQRGALLRWDGATFTEELIGTSEDLIAVWGVGPDRVAVVGGRSNGVVSTFDGTEWHTTSLSPLPGINGVFMRDPNTVYIAGVEGTLGRLDFDTQELTDESLFTRTDLHAIHGAGNRLTTVGGNFAFVTGPYEGIAYRREFAADE